MPLKNIVQFGMPPLDFPSSKPSWCTCGLWIMPTNVEYGMVWYGMVWYGMVWYGMVWYDKTLFNDAGPDSN
jgi:hypothetical protein